MAVAAGLAAWQIAQSVAFGTGPPGLTALRTVDPAAIAAQLTLAVAATPDTTVIVPAVTLAALGALLPLRTGTRLFALRLVVWLVLPLALELYLGTIRTNLFRLRYWIAFLPPLAALAGLGAAQLAALGAHLVDRLARLVTGSALPALQGATLLVTATALAALPLATTISVQQQLRGADGHAQDLSAVMAGLHRALSLDPAARVILSDHSASGMLAAVDPALASTPLLQLDPALPTVYTTPLPYRDTIQELAGARDLLWIDKANATARGAARHLPPALAPLHP